MEQFDAKIEVPFHRVSGGFRLENGREQLQTVFSEIECVICDSDLLVDDAEPVYEYVYSFPGNAAELIRDRKEEFLSKVEKLIERDGAFYIHKSTGMFRCRVNENREDVIARIKRMEQYFDEIGEIAKKDTKEVYENDVLRKKWQELLAYYEGGQWLKDFECDERGELPKNLKRGVLSEDGVYNLITKIEE